MGAVGFEPSPVTGGYYNHLQQRGIPSAAQSGAVERQPSPDDPELRRVTAAWPMLPEPIKAAVLALVDTVSGVPGTETPTHTGATPGFGDKSAAGPSDADSPERPTGTAAERD